jgi:hypothetical protein
MVTQFWRVGRRFGSCCPTYHSDPYVISLNSFNVLGIWSMLIGIKIFCVHNKDSLSEIPRSYTSREVFGEENNDTFAPILEWLFSRATWEKTYLASNLMIELDRIKARGLYPKRINMNLSIKTLRNLESLDLEIAAQACLRIDPQITHLPSTSSSSSFNTTTDPASSSECSTTLRSSSSSGLMRGIGSTAMDIEASAGAAEFSGGSFGNSGGPLVSRLLAELSTTSAASPSATARSHHGNSVSITTNQSPSTSTADSGNTSTSSSSSSTGYGPSRHSQSPSAQHGKNNDDHHDSPSPFGPFITCTRENSSSRTISNSNSSTIRTSNTTTTTTNTSSSISNNLRSNSDRNSLTSASTPSWLLASSSTASQEEHCTAIALLLHCY